MIGVDAVGGEGRRPQQADRPAVTINIKTQIASTIATSFIDMQAESRTAYSYKIVAVDESGNAGP